MRGEVGYLSLQMRALILLDDQKSKIPFRPWPYAVVRPRGTTRRDPGRSTRCLPSGKPIV
ncbi:hypothetical protein HJFPF1_08111 [Paramyrothecium foliicola]|nr:hypothetical protein HJFPF1_08111 [Paramyrothecium foliicola]